jgi:predicted transcriptional regulator of viral defense system
MKPASSNSDLARMSDIAQLLDSRTLLASLRETRWEILKDISRRASAGKLLDELKHSANGAAWKRLGYLIELLGPEHGSLLNAARAKLTTGNIKLDPAIRTKGTLSSPWKLWANVKLTSDTGEA